MSHLDRRLIEGSLLVLFATLLVHTLKPSEPFVVQMIGAVAGITLYEVIAAIIRVIKTRKGLTA